MKIRALYEAVKEKEEAAEKSEKTTAKKRPADVFMKDWSEKGDKYEIAADVGDDEVNGCYIDFNSIMNLEAVEDEENQGVWKIYLTGVSKGMSIKSFGKDAKSEQEAKKVYNGLFKGLCDLIPEGYSGNLLDVFTHKSVSEVAKANGLKNM